MTEKYILRLECGHEITKDYKYGVGVSMNCLVCGSETCVAPSPIEVTSAGNPVIVKPGYWLAVESEEGELTIVKVSEWNGTRQRISVCGSENSMRLGEYALIRHLTLTDLLK